MQNLSLILKVTRKNLLKTNLLYCSQQNQYKNIQPEVRETIFNILKDSPKCTKKDIQYEDKFEDLGFDSLDIVECIVAFEENLGIELSEDDAENKIKTVGNALVIFSRMYQVQQQNQQKEE